MYKSNLNFERFNRYFYELLQKGFIEEIDKSQSRDEYKITERGKTLLDVLKKAEAILFSEDYWLLYVYCYFSDVVIDAYYYFYFDVA